MYVAIISCVQCIYLCSEVYECVGYTLCDIEKNGKYQSKLLKVKKTLNINYFSKEQVKSTNFVWSWILSIMNLIILITRHWNKLAIQALTSCFDCRDIDDIVRVVVVYG